MLPFLKPKNLSSVIMAKRVKADGTSEPEAPKGEHAPELMAAAESLISAVHAKDAAAVCEALSAAQACLDKGDSNEA